jgi:LDH2 family malate/lactate/ureidoglycolate dehydrogenase
MRTAKPAPGEDAVLIPGDPEREAERHRSVHGIPLLRAVIETLEEAARLARVDMPAAIGD